MLAIQIFLPFLFIEKPLTERHKYKSWLEAIKNKSCNIFVKTTLIYGEMANKRENNEIVTRKGLWKRENKSIIFKERQSFFLVEKEGETV